MHNHKQAFPFLRLPLDLQHRICAGFCSHCSIPANAPLDILKHTAGDEFRTLKALSETCKSVSSLALPLLYHHPDVKCYSDLFCTLLARPDLANNTFIFSRIYESMERKPEFYELQTEREDLAQLKNVARQLNLLDPDDIEYQNTFQYLLEPELSDQLALTHTTAIASFHKLITSIFLILAPRLQFAVIEIDDGAFIHRHAAPIRPFPYLPEWLAKTGRQFTALRTIVFRNPFHHALDNLGVEHASFLFSATPNVQHIVFQYMGGFRPRYLDKEPELENHWKNSLLDWPALSNIQQLYFHPCVRHDDSVPYLGIRNLVHRCSRLRRFMFRLRYPADNALFSPAELMQAVLPAKDTLESMELFCSDAKTPYLRSSSLLTAELKQFTNMKALVLDEQSFCHHWNNRDAENDCLVNILPETITSLTVRLHDKFKIVPDLVRLGRHKKLGCFSQLSEVQVDVLQDFAQTAFHGHRDPEPPGFDQEYLLFGKARLEWGPTVMELTRRIRPAIMDAFEDAHCVVRVEYLEEQLHATGEEYTFPPSRYL